jgi:5-methylcytosine-specific restriction endonuclease McrA
MSNPRITAQEWGLIKAAIRRVFSRSDLRRKVVARVRLIHADPERPRVKKWVVCAICEQKVPEYLVQVDHISPVVPLDQSLEEIGIASLVDNIWCEEENLQVLCVDCHNFKSKAENAIRREHKKKKPKKVVGKLRRRKRRS